MPYPCGNCAKDVAKNSKSVACNVCELWFHVKCIDGMTDDFYESCVYAAATWGCSAFFCKCCRKATAKMSKSIGELKDEVKRLEKRLDELEKGKETVAQRVTQVEERAERVTVGLEGVEREIISGMEKAKEEAKKEMKKERRIEEKISENITVYGLAESEKETVNEQNEEDKDKIVEMARVMGVEIGDVEIKFRAGRPREDGDTRPRPLIVKIADGETRAKMLENGRKLARDDDWRRVFVSPELTREQREEERKKEKERKEDAEKRSKEAKKDKRMVKYIVVGRGERRRVIEVARTAEVGEE